jgi:hypothetical protein
MRRRLGESPPPVALYGPLIVTLLIAGCVPRLRIAAASVASSRASVRCTNATPINFGPAFSVEREFESDLPQRLDPGHRRAASALLTCCIHRPAPLPATAGRSTEGGVGSGSEGSG